MKEYTFDVKMFAGISVKAESMEEAIELIREHLSSAEANFGAWPNGDPILGGVSLDDDDPDLIEVDGEPVEIEAAKLNEA